MSLPRCAKASKLASGQKVPNEIGNNFGNKRTVGNATFLPSTNSHVRMLDAKQPKCPKRSFPRNQIYPAALIGVRPANAERRGPNRRPLCEPGPRSFRVELHCRSGTAGAFSSASGGVAAGIFGTGTRVSKWACKIPLSPMPPLTGWEFSHLELLGRGPSLSVLGSFLPSVATTYRPATCIAPNRRRLIQRILA